VNVPPVSQPTIQVVIFAPSSVRPGARAGPR
jgi:hypothetical protein